jgi:hypothetical protein
MVNIIVLGSKNVVKDSNQNKLTYTFLGSGISFRNNKVALLSATFYNSMFNIHSSKYNNQSFSYVWLDGLTYNITIPNGYYSVADLNSYLHYVFDQNKHYLIDPSNNNVLSVDPNDKFVHKYLIDLVTNDTYYGVQMNFTAYNNTTTYTKPSGVSWTLTGSLKCPQITFGQNNFKLLLGYESGTFPSVNTESTYTLSSYTPQISPISSILVRCSLVNSKYGLPIDVIHGLPINNTYGNIITSDNSNATYIDIVDGHCSEFTVTLVDQEGRDIEIRDTSMIITLGIM